MKAVLMSIQPRWVELIASGKKTVEVRKTKPKLDTPFKVYIYMTMGKCPKFVYNEKLEKQSIYEREPNTANGKVIGEFVCDGIYPFHYDLSKGFYEPREFLWGSRLSLKQLKEYVGGSLGYSWNITDLVIYDKPRELREFAKPAKTTYDNEGYLLCDGCDFADWRTDIVCTMGFCPDRMITRPPQSWCYVEEVNDGT